MSFRDQMSSQRAAARTDADAIAGSDAARGESLFERLKSRFAKQADKPKKPSKKAKLAKKARGGRTPITAHKSFVPLITGWGAALAGLSIAVLPPAAIQDFVETAQLNALGGFARIALVALAALFGGLVAYAIARLIRNGMTTSANIDPEADDEDDAFMDEDFADEEREPLVINPSVELGSESFDAPLEFDEFQIEDQHATITRSDEEPPLDLSEVAQVLAYKEDETAPVTEPEPTASPPPIPAEAPDFLKGSAVESLRRMSTDNMSLMQMVERFATALHAHQATVGETGQSRRDAALAEALRALSLFTESKNDAAEIASRESASLTAGGFTDRAQQTERELHDALTKLQKLSGAA